LTVSLNEPVNKKLLMMLTRLQNYFCRKYKSYTLPITKMIICKNPSQYSRRNLGVASADLPVHHQLDTF